MKSLQRFGLLVALVVALSLVVSWQKVTDTHPLSEDMEREFNIQHNRLKSGPTVPEMFLRAGDDLEQCIDIQ